MHKKYFIIIVLTAVFLSGCGAKREYCYESNEHIFDDAFLNYTPDYITALLPEDISKEEAYNSFSEDLLEFNLAEFGRYDGLEMGSYGASFYPTSEDEGFVLKLYGLNQAELQYAGEVYFFDGEQYKLIHRIDDSIPGCCAITDGENLYIPLDNGTLRSVSTDGSIKDYCEAFDSDGHYINFVYPYGNGNVIELKEADKTIGSVTVA